MKLSTVICNYNTRDKLARALESLQQQAAGLAHEIIVADNASNDGSAAMVRARFPDVRLFETGANLWFSGGNNVGIRAAQGAYVLILNPDTVILPGALDTLIAYLDAHPAVGAVTSRMIWDDGRLQMNGSRFPAFGDLLLAYSGVGVLFPGWRERRRRRMWYADWDRESTRAIEVAPGSCLMVRREILAAIGGFDEALKLFYTDDDLCRQIRQTGAAIHYVAEATIIHDEHASVDQVPRTTRRVYFEDMLAYAQKYHGRLAAGVLAIALGPTRLAMELKRRAKTPPAPTDTATDKG